MLNKEICKNCMDRFRAKHPNKRASFDWFVTPGRALRRGGLSVTAEEERKYRVIEGMIARGWVEHDEARWDAGKVMCDYPNMVDVGGDAPDWCPYQVEHAVSQEC